MLETTMYLKLNDLLPFIMFQRIETTTGLGVPDIIYGHKLIQGWIELKELKQMPRKVANIPWRPGQLAWHHDYKFKYNNAMPYYLILTIDDYWYIIPDIKAQYTIEELTRWYICTTSELTKNKLHIKKILLKEYR